METGEQTAEHSPAKFSVGLFPRLEELKAELARYPQLSVRYLDDLISVEAPEEGGFRVELEALGRNSYRVWFGNWRENFSDEEKALDCFMFGLSEDCRVEINSAGKFDFRWTMQMLEEGRWRPFSTTSMLIFPFWRKRQIRYLQNHTIQAGAGADATEAKVATAAGDEA